MRLSYIDPMACAAALFGADVWRLLDAGRIRAGRLPRSSNHHDARVRRGGAPTSSAASCRKGFRRVSASRLSSNRAPARAATRRQHAHRQGARRPPRGPPRAGGGGGGGRGGGGGIRITGAHSVSPALYKSLPYDALADFQMLSTTGFQAFIVAVREDSKFKTLADLIAFAKENPGKLTYSSVGVGSTQHLAE